MFGHVPIYALLSPERLGRRLLAWFLRALHLPRSARANQASVIDAAETPSGFEIES